MATAPGPSETAAQPPQMVPEHRECVGCGVVSRFRLGYEPDWAAWFGGRCPACNRKATQAAAREMTTEEQDALALSGLEEGKLIYEVERETGIDVQRIRQVKRRAIRDGTLPQPRKKSEREKAADQQVTKEERRLEREARGIDADLAALRGLGEATSKSLAAVVGSSPRTAGRRLHVLEQAGLAVREETRVGRGGRCVTYRPAGDPPKARSLEG